MEKGTVIKSTGSWYSVQTETGKIIDCRILGKFRLEGLKLTNPIAVGDVVMIQLEEQQETAIIKEILPRKNYILRQSPRKKHYMHLLAANVDQAAVIVTIRFPDLKPGFIDRFLLMTTPHDIPSSIIINKADIYDEEDLELCEIMKEVYESIGYPVFVVSALKDQGLEELRAYLKDKITFITGHSGVGKSTLANALQPGLELRTTELSDYSGKGQHTTTFAEMLPLDIGGSIIDTPGIKELAFINMDPIDIAHNFVELFEASKECRFHDCLHINEPHCAVKKGLEEGLISELRYSNYLKLVEEAKEQNYWERKTDW
ncbi:MAG: ribosome small subunit-dependent GTPase A [Bacteroidota bacterium]